MNKDNYCHICGGILAFLAQNIACCLSCRVSFRWPWRLREEE